MFVRTKKKSSGKTAVQIVESQRKGNSVVQNVVRYVGQAETAQQLQELEKLARALIGELIHERSQPYLPGIDPESVITTEKELTLESEKDFQIDVRNLREEQRVITGIHEVFGKLYDLLGYDKILPSADPVLRSCVFARVANASSKLKTAAFLEEDYGIKLPVDRIYRMMDKLLKEEERVKTLIGQSTLSLFLEPVTVLFFDVTTLYFESHEQDALRKTGFSKDAKFKEGQVVLALVTTKEGHPLTYELFPGNTYEGGTLIKIIEKLKERFTVDSIILVADRAMFNEENLTKMEEMKISYIVAAKLKSLPKKVQENILNSALYQPQLVEDELHWIKEFDHKGRRLIVSYSSIRARKDAADRKRLLDKLSKITNNDGIPAPKLHPNRGIQKYISWNKNSKATIDERKIHNDSLWDGMHGVITNIKLENPNVILSNYRGLWQIEEAFRINKHDLKMRPIYHWTEDRVKAHILICFIAFALVKQALHRIKIQSGAMSLETLRSHLLHAQASIVVDTKSKRRYVIPSKVTAAQKRIYSVFGLKRTERPQLAN